MMLCRLLLSEFILERYFDVSETQLLINNNNNGRIFDDMGAHDMDILPDTIILPDTVIAYTAPSLRQ
jgi:hypothetical protein